MSRRTLISTALLAFMAMAMFSFGAGAAGPTKVVFWYSVGGKVAETTRELVDRFNTTHSSIQVEAIYQGSYDDAINKLKASIAGKSTPNVMQSYEIGSRFMIDSKVIVPLQKYIDRDKIDVSTFERNILAYYEINDQLYSMPFNVSTPLLYFNKDMFREAGLDLNKPPLTFDEVVVAARKLTKRDSAGKVTRPGMALAVYGWFFEQFLAASNLTYANNGNGRDATATAVSFAVPEAAAILDWWNGMVKEGITANLGRKTADTQKAFIAGQCAMTIDSTAVLATILAGVNNQFEVGVGYLPRPAGAKGGVMIGGGTLWLLSNHAKEEEEAAWEFIKWMTEPEQQAYWHMNTGYFPITKKAYDVPELKAHQAKYPQFATAVKQLRDTPVTRATQGALLGVFTQARTTVEDAIEQVLTGKSSSLDALKKAAATIDAAINRYNMTTK
ncbi:MAG: ABC transporter substrate-binding protein [Clostridia bacterium]|nr:ABC transporter substrate-binding protein [Clostridia bacterium]